MNLVDHAAAAASFGSLERVTLDELFRRAALRHPRDFALIDPADRRHLADGAPRFVTYAAADRVVSGIAGRLHALGLARHSVVAMQIPNLVEGVLTLLGIWRAGMIAAPLPLLWRRADMVAALARVGAKAIICGGRVAETELSEIALQTAMELFPIRYVCAFGNKCPDGAIALDELFAADRLDPVPHLARGDDPSAELALVTWDTTIHGNVPVARNHAQVVAAGFAISLEGQIEPNAKILATPHFGSFSGIALTLMPWLLTGGTLILHQAFDPQVFANQCAEQSCDSVVLPGPLVAQLAAAGLLSSGSIRNVLAAWRSPERLSMSPAWHGSAGLTDVQVFGETGLIAARREASGQPVAFAAGPVRAPRSGGVLSLEVARGVGGTLLLRGPMVPRDSFPAGLADDDPLKFKVDGAGFADTGYPCRVERGSNTILLSGPPAGIISVGGYRFAQRGFNEMLGQPKDDTALAALPDPLLNHRLAGRAPNPAAARKALTAEGAHALVVAAFRDRRKSEAA